MKYTLTKSAQIGIKALLNSKGWADLPLDFYSAGKIFKQIPDVELKSVEGEAPEKTNERLKQLLAETSELDLDRDDLAAIEKATKAFIAGKQIGATPDIIEIITVLGIK